MGKTLAVAFAALCSSCATPPPALGAHPIEIPMLLKNAAVYDGKLVQIRGASVVRFEAKFICPSLDQIDGDRVQECLALREGIGEGYGPDRMVELHGKHVILVGRFNRSELGHGGAYGGSIVPIRVRVTATHAKGEIPPPPPEPSANNSSKPKPLRGSA